MRVFFATPLILVLSAPAVAGDKPKSDAEETPALVESLYACRDVGDPAARLACYDRETAGLKAADDANEIMIVDRAQVRAARKGLFGLSIPKIRLFDGVDDEDGEEIQELTTTITRATESGGRYSFVLEDGARWVQTDNTPIIIAPDAGEQIVIKQGALGSYMAKVGNRRAVRVKRVD